MPNLPKKVSIQADIELTAIVSGSLIDEFNGRSEGFMNLQVGRDLNVFPNYYNLVLLLDADGIREAILTQCNGVYDPEEEELAAGLYPFVRLTRNIESLPDHVLSTFIAADPRILETGGQNNTIIRDITVDDTL